MHQQYNSQYQYLSRQQNKQREITNNYYITQESWNQPNTNRHCRSNQYHLQEQTYHQQNYQECIQADQSETTNLPVPMPHPWQGY